MGSTPDATQRKAAREATDWLLLLSEEPDDQDLRRRFEAWRDASPLHAESWNSTLHMSAVTRGMPAAYRHEWGGHPRQPSGEPLQVEHPAATMADKPIVRPRLLTARMGAMLAGVALACIAVLAAPAILIQLRSDYTTTTAELRTVLLEDGSEVTLAPKSAIAVDYVESERRIDLLQGMAFFSVRKNVERPFRVQAGTLRTTVLGTRFEVRCADDGVTVSVEEGLVALDDSTQPSLDLKLGAGQSALMARTGSAIRESNAAVAPWRQRLMLADDRPVGEAVADLARYYGGAILIADAALAQRRVTGVYGLGDPEAALRDIARAIGADVRRLSPWVLILTSK